RVASVTSGARFWDEASDEEIAAEVLGDARAVLPGLRDARCTRSLVVRERHATISLTPAADAVRPGVTTRMANLFLAGDWVQTGLPATIEGAVQAGREAARRALVAPVAPTSDVIRGRSEVLSARTPRAHGVSDDSARVSSCVLIPTPMCLPVAPIAVMRCAPSPSTRSSPHTPTRSPRRS